MGYLAAVNCSVRISSAFVCPSSLGSSRRNILHKNVSLTSRSACNGNFPSISCTSNRNVIQRMALRRAQQSGSALGGSRSRSWCMRAVGNSEHSQQQQKNEESLEEDGDDSEWVEEEWDEGELDDLFEKYGETLLSDPTVTREAQEAADEAESLSLAMAIAEAANDGKGGEILVLNVKPLVYWTRYFVIVTAFSKPQADAIAKRMRDIVAEKFHRKQSGGDRQNSSGWTLVDFGDVVVHLFMPKDRSFYNLEEFYGNAAVVDLPFTSRSMN
eukprot:jgi/Mesen1/2000/ME000147S01098